MPMGGILHRELMQGKLPRDRVKLTRRRITQSDGHKVARLPQRRNLGHGIEITGVSVRKVGTTGEKRHAPTVDDHRQAAAFFVVDPSRIPLTSNGRCKDRSTAAALRHDATAIQCSPQPDWRGHGCHAGSITRS
jgi:hypothetical protein